MYVWQSINVERERGTSLQESLPTFLFCPGPGACESIARAYCRASRNRGKHILPNRTHAQRCRWSAYAPETIAHRVSGRAPHTPRPRLSRTAVQ